jgi:hypothetical protein
MIGGFVFSLIVFAVGAILNFAVTVSPYQHGFNVRTVGVILMIIGGIGAVVTLIVLLSDNRWHRHRSIVEDDRGNTVRREDTYL